MYRTTLKNTYTFEKYISTTTFQEWTIVEKQAIGIKR